MQIAIIGCGEVGGAYARALNSQAALSLCDILLTGRPRALADELALELHAAPGGWLRACDIAIAAVPGRASPEAASAALPFMAGKSLYIDVSTGAPDALRASSETFSAKGCGFVDVAIMGAIALTGGATPVLIAGAGAEQARKPFGLMGAKVEILADGKPGDAVALKLLRSVIVKGLECLSIESLTAAECLGVRERLFDVLGDFDRSPMAEFMGALVKTHILHAERRMHEMEESAAQLRALGFDAAVTSALAERYAATLKARENDPPAADTHETLDKALSWLVKAGQTKPL